MSSDQHIENPKSAMDLNYAEKIREGNVSAYSALFRKYYEPLYRFAGRYVKDPQIAENLVQDVFVIIWSKRENWHITSNVKSYLYTAVRNHALNFLKRDKRLLNMEEGTDYADSDIRPPDQELMDKEMATAVHNAINKLPPRCRQIYVMHRYDELKYTEIAEILSISINTVKTQMKRAMQSLSKNLTYLLSIIFTLILEKL